MTNTNCLEGIKCPACGNEDRFRIAGTAVFTVTDEGAEDHGDIEWDDDSYADCPDCFRHGTLKDFRAQPSSPVAAASDPAKKPYSVLLLYPDYASDNYGQETYYAWVQAPDPIAAVAEAQRQAVAAQIIDIDDPIDFHPLLVTQGHHYGQPLSNN
jgi:hypothetical protein